MNLLITFLRPLVGIIALLFVFQVSLAQEAKSNYVGVLLAYELQYREVRPNLGFFYEKNFTPKSGMEVGIFYRTDVDQIFVSIQQTNFTISETLTFRKGNLNFPFLYRFSTRFAALSVGPSIDILSGWNQLDEDQIKLTRYSRTPTVEVGALLKIGREIPLKGSLILEPELRMGFRSVIFPEGYIGLGVKLKEIIGSGK